MSEFICTACGVQHAAVPGNPDQPPSRCVVCEDDRQYVSWNGQQWTTVAELRAKGHRNNIFEAEPGLTEVATEPRFGIGQRGLLVQTPAGNLLWDCTPLLGDETVEAIRARGGLAAIAISHPHFYS